MAIISKIFEDIVTLFFKIFFYLFPHKKISKELAQTIELYKDEGFGYNFAKIRSWDAPYEPINKIIKKNAKVLDLGCGDGLLANYLAISSKRRKIFGIDKNKSRIDKAYKGLKNTSFKLGDVLNIKIINPDVVILAHVLHHLPSKEDQFKLLRKIHKNLKPQKEIVILEIDKKPILKYLFTWITDAITVPLLFEKKLFDFKFFYRDSSEWKSLLTKIGFNVSVKHVHKGMPFSHVLIYGKKTV